MRLWLLFGRTRTIPTPHSLVVPKTSILCISSRSSSSKAPTVSFLEKAKSTKTSINGKGIVGSSSRTATAIGNSKKAIFESRRKLTSQSSSEAPENGSIDDEKDGSDLVQSGRVSNGNRNGARAIAKKTNSKTESSSIFREKKMNGLSISDSRRTLNAASSAPFRSSVNANTRTNLATEPSHESSTQRKASAIGNGLSSSRQFSTEATSRRPFSSTRVRNNNRNGDRPPSPLELGSSLSLENLQHYKIDGVAEVLLALERIEQDEELTYELMLLERRLLLNGIAFYDQHRDVRLDIDDMSYEELLALEERMGIVSTALTEEAMSRCLTRTIFDSNDCGFWCCSGDKNDVKCCICQEEYVNGDEVGGLECKHWFHEECIQQWLRQKNWCPICKASAELRLPGRPSPATS